MIKENISILRKFEMLMDLIIATSVFFWAYPFQRYTPLLPAFLVVWLTLLNILGLYKSFRIGQFVHMFFTIFGSALIGIGIFGALAYVYKIEDLNRLFIHFIFLGSAFLTLLEKYIVIFFFKIIRKKGYNSRNVLIVGTGSQALNFMDLINNHNEWGLKIVGLIDEDKSLRGKIMNGHKVIGNLHDIADIVHENVVDEIIFIVPRSWLQQVEKIVSFCEIEGIRAHIAIDFFNLKFSKSKQVNLGNFKLISFDRSVIKEWQILLKTGFDIVLSAILLIVLMPLFVLLAIMIKLTSKGPVIYKQIRCGLNGRKFTLYKFRTMVENSEQMLLKLKSSNEMKGPAYKMANDPRVTKIGKYLRKYSLDELPQLWNVFKCDMSLVGPRPPLPEEVKEYNNWHRRRLSMRPGITCLWQVQGRNQISDFNEWAQLDLNYIDHWSILLDFKILFKTIPTVIFAIGAR